MPPERLTRRNGLPLSCEPCRKSKVRCDHQGPQCSRCISRKIICVYNLAETTRAGQTPKRYQRHASIGLTTSNVARSPVVNVPTARPSHSENIVTTSASPAHSTGTNGSSETIKRVALFHKQGASYGPTRFSAVFSENQTTFASAIQDVIEPPAGSLISSPTQGVDAKSEPLKELAIETLLSFPSLRTCEALLQDIDFIHDVWVSPTMVRHCLGQVWSQYGEKLHDRSRDSVWAIAKDFHENGKHPVPSADVEREFDWMNWFSGPNLRWEMIGILFVWAGMAFKRKQEWDPLFALPEQQGRDRQTTADRMRECVLACLKFSQDFSEISDINVCLMKNSVKLQSIIISDECEYIFVFPWAQVS